ncbi:inositol-pentakisphosphate 2-kinase [Lenzites betulinus]|nr:inositol-pentakisphosphate 2-kinase [Lenzites betulinus]
MSEDLLRIAETAPEHWKYISEGGSTIVFSYTGPPDARFSGTALRLRKAPVSAHSDIFGAHEDTNGNSNTQTAAEQEEEDEPDDPTVIFQRAVIERLVPAAHLPQLRSVRVERAWLARLAAGTELLRPAERRARDAIDTGRRKAVLATDLVGGEGWAVEIKPKWGFLPAPTHLSPRTRATKTHTCRFCMHAHLKHAHGEPVARAYCPLDLFAGARAPERVRGALCALWDAWVGSGGGVNNLRVFIGGRMVRPGGEPTALATSLEPLAALLLPPRTPTPTPTSTPTSISAPTTDFDTNTLRDAFIDTLTPILLASPILPTLSRLQRTLDALDIEGLAALWARVHPLPSPLGEGMPDPDVEEWARFVEEHDARTSAAAGGQSMAEPPATEEELRYRALAHLLGASFKDCSLMIRLPPSSSDAAAQEEVEKKATATVTVIDLDVKGVDRLAKWAALDREIVDAYRAATAGAGEAEAGEGPRRCVDAWYGAEPLP